MNDHRRYGESRKAPARHRPRATTAMAITGLVVAWWLIFGAAILLMLPPSAASAPGVGVVLARGQTARINQPGIPNWPMPVDRVAFDEFQRGTRESDEDAINRAFAGREWLPVSHGQLVLIVDFDSEAVLVELLEGPHAGRTGWLRPWNLML